MITPELTEYIKGEFAKGRTREEIHTKLVADGGWSEIDLNEAFRAVIPMQNFTKNPLAGANSFSKKSSGAALENLIFIIIGILCVTVWWFYRAPIVNWWNSFANSVTELPFFSARNNEVIPPSENTANNTAAKEIREISATVRDCGTSTAPDFEALYANENDEVYVCLGNSAFSCEGAKAVLEDDLFPTIFQITRESQDNCNFRLSYKEDSNLVDASGKNLAGQYISCPLGIVKSVDEGNPQINPQTPAFNAPNTENLGKYASQIYFYGAIGLFMENNVDSVKIKSLGCSGPYIDSVAASYANI
jgi:hypothetical protein